jgi:zinc D-Ala-D-Ala carboxypeptidase
MGSKGTKHALHWWTKATGTLVICGLAACASSAEPEVLLPLTVDEPIVVSVQVPPLRKLLGHVDPATDSAFAEIPAHQSSRSGLFLRRKACKAFVAMYDSAAQSGVALTALSATRPFGHQASIWNRKWNRPQAMGMAPVERARHILRFSSMPGSSRHHWGTDIDMVSLEPEDFKAGKCLRALEWLRSHAAGFGFVEVYTPDPDRPGYQPEAWHWSYMPLAGPFLDAINAAQADGTFPPFSGFDGAHTADSLFILEHYINGVSRTGWNPDRGL